MTKKERTNLQRIVSEWAKVAENGDNIRLQNGEVVIYNYQGCEINREYIGE